MEAIYGLTIMSGIPENPMDRYPNHVSAYFPKFGAFIRQYRFFAKLPIPD